MSNRINRRQFIRGAAATTAGLLIVGPGAARSFAANESLGIAFIGTGGRGKGHLGLAQDLKSDKAGNRAVCFADVDPKQWPKQFPSAASYTDFRKMFDQKENDIDAVVVSTPDHTHFVAAYSAMLRGKHCYCEKPLTYAPWESRVLADLAIEKKLATQMGNQGHSNEGNRRIVAYVRGGAIGDVKEIHTWTNRPVWPQGAKAAAFHRAGGKPPAQLDWDNWLGPRPYRDYHEKLHRFDWRGWLDFGTGTIGDMGCHTWDAPFWAMEPTYPERVEILKADNLTDQTYPDNQIIRFRFPAEKGRPEFKAFWYDGGWKPDMPEEWEFGAGQWNKINSGSLYIGTKGKLVTSGDYGDRCYLIPRARHKEYGQPKRLFEASPGHHEEWVRACKGTEAWDYPKSNFTYGGALTETMLLGVIALKTPGMKIDCDWKNRKVLTTAAMPHYKPTYRKEWVKDLGVKL